MDQASIRDHLAASYAAGALGPALTLLVRTQAAMVPDAARRVAAAEAMAGAFLEEETQAPLRASALEDVFARIAQAEEAAFEPAARAKAAHFAEEIEALPEPVREAALKALGARAFVFGGPGLRVLPLMLEEGLNAELIRIEPGFAAPRHTHGGEELTLVLTGAFRDERGRYEIGEIAVAGPGVTHTPRAEPGAVCWNLAVSEAPLEFTGLLGAVQKILKH